MIKRITRTCLVLALTLGVSLLYLISHQPPVNAAETAATDDSRALPEVPKGLSQEEIRDLIARLSELDRQAPQETQRGTLATGGLFQTFQEEGERIRDIFAGMVAAVDALPTLPVLLWSQLTFGGIVSGWHIFAEIVAFLLIGILAEWAYRRVSTLASIRRRQSTSQTMAARLGFLSLQALIDLFGILVFALTAIALMYMSGSKTSAQPLLFMTIMYGLTNLRLVLLVSRFILAPKTGWLRTVPLSDHAARAIHTRVLLVASALVFSRCVSQFLWGSGLDVALLELVVLILYSITPVIIVAVIWQARAPVTACLGRTASDDGGVSPLRQSLAANWHVFASAYVLVIFAAGILISFGTQRDAFGPVVASWLLLVIVPAADAGLQALVVRLFRPRAAIAATPTGADEPEAEGTAAHKADEGTYEAVALRNLRILLALLVACVFAKLWHIDMMGFAEALLGSRLAEALIETSVAVLMAYAVWGFVKAAVERNVALETRRKDEQDSGGEVGGPGATRLATLLPLLRKFVVITLSVMVVLIAISSLGINIGPLIAGAGVVGIAIGFGAQTLVKDIVSGLFFLIDDAFRMGEYVEIEKTRGQVEKISIRSLQLRHHNGPVHTIPFGEIKQLTNYSRDWIIMKFDLRVPFETNIDRVRKIVKKIGEEMMQDPELAPMMLEPLKSQGITHMDDSALIVRCKFKAKPGQQFMVRRVAFMRIQQAFADEGIRFAPRRVIVETTTPKEAVQAAASAIATEQEAATKADKPRLV